jgi:hypothetical protein
VNAILQGLQKELRRRRFIFKKRAEQTKNIQKLQNDTLQMCKLMIASI